MKYESGETFESMSLRYSMVLNLLNYSDIKVTTPKLTDGQLIDRLRKSAYSETTERLLILFSYGLIDEKLLRNLVLGILLVIYLLLLRKILNLKTEGRSWLKLPQVIGMLLLKAVILKLIGKLVITKYNKKRFPAGE